MKTATAKKQVVVDRPSPRKDARKITHPFRRSGALRKARAALSGAINTYHRELERALASKVGAESSFALVDMQIDGSRYLLLKVTSVPFRSLTDRQGEIALAVAEGLSNKEVANRFSITLPTVAAHLRAIYRKLNVRSRSELLLVFLHDGDCFSSKQSTSVS